MDNKQIEIRAILTEIWGDLVSKANASEEARGYDEHEWFDAVMRDAENPTGDCVL
jgi:hypothetical protein